MRLRIGTSLVILTMMVSAPAMALDRYGQVAGGGRAVASDPSDRLDRLAAASTPSGGDHARPSKSGRSILKDDRYLRAAFAWLDNKEHRAADGAGSDGPMSYSRRLALKGLAIAAGWSGASAILRAQQLFAGYPFRLGVAAGEPTPDGFVIWARLAPEPLAPGGGMAMAPVAVDWIARHDREQEGKRQALRKARRRRTHRRALQQIGCAGTCHHVSPCRKTSRMRNDTTYLDSRGRLEPR